MNTFSRRGFLAASTAAASFGASRRKSGPPPNILYIMADDHASHAISAYGSRINRTPNIDALAKAGVRLTNCFCTNSICTPSRAAILTGQYSHVNGVKTLNDRIDPGRPHVGKYLQAAGYETAMIGKWHLESDPAGFDYWNILPGQGLYHNPDLIELGKRTKHQGYATDLITDFSLNWLQKGRNPNKPFFLMCHHKAPHRPWEPDSKHAHLFDGVTIPEPDNLYDHYKNRSNAARNATLQVGRDMTKMDLKVDKPAGLAGDELRKWAYQLYIKDYLRCVASVDDNVGRMLGYLDSDENLKRNTIVIYTSDQGFFLGDHGWFDKRFMMEESLRMPFLMRYPGDSAIRPGSVATPMSLNVDFAPMFLDYAGAAIPKDMQGHSMRPVVEGRHPSGWRKSMYYRYWMHLADHGVASHYGVRTERYKLVYYYGQALGTKGSIDKPTPPEWELFDLKNDPREMRSVYGDPKYAHVTAALKTELSRLQKEVADTPA
jgi:arylsulfatase A-like enzyme